jgi:hypothetical protein
MFKDITTHILLIGSILGFFVRALMFTLFEYLDNESKISLTKDSFHSPLNRPILKSSDNGEGSSKDVSKDNNSKDSPRDNGEGSSKDVPAAGAFPTKRGRITLEDYTLDSDNEENTRPKKTLKQWVPSHTAPKMDKDTAVANLSKYMEMYEEYETSGQYVPAAKEQKALLLKKIAECESIINESDSESDSNQDKKGKGVKRDN